MRRFRTLIAVATVGIFAVAACGNDTDEAATTTTTTSSTTSTTEAEQTDEATLAFCQAFAETGEQGPPTEEQLQELSDLAPPAVKEDVDLLAEQFIEKGPAAFGDPEVGEALGRVEAWEADNCPGTAAGAGEEEEEEAAPQTPDPDATQVAVTATDFEFAIDGDVPAEKVAFVMANEGETPHHMSILKFKEGTTAEQAEQAFEDGSVPQLVEEEVGQSSDAAPGEEAVVNAELEPGIYGMGCFVDEPDGVPHFFKGMRVVFEVS